MKIKEKYKVVPGYEDYEVSDFGNVRSLKFGKIKVLRSKLNNGYLQVGLCKNGERKMFFVHRLVVSAFIGPIAKGMQVNHINEDKSDNRLSNLEIVTAKQNTNHGTRNERMGKSRSRQLDLMEAEYPHREYTFSSSYEASEFFGYKNKSTIASFIFYARQRGENFIKPRKTKYFFAQEG